MAGRGRNANQALQGADPALVQILQMMQNRDANRDNSQKQFLMFPKESFTGQDKKKAKSHWAKFSKYLDYQDQQGTIPQQLANLAEIKSMFKLMLQDIALGWFETESPHSLTEDQMKQVFLKRCDTRRQQQDAWNKLKFDMTKDDVDTLVVNMKMLASIPGHNDKAIMEMFNNIFPDPNIEAALIAMGDFATMQAKAKQLVQIYKPTHDSTIASAAILVHTEGDSTAKSKTSQPKSNQHQLAPINPSQDQNSRGMGIMVGDNADGGTDVIVAHMAVETPIIDMNIIIGEEAVVNQKGTFKITEVEVKIIHLEGNEDNGMVMTPLTMTGIIGIGMLMANIIPTEAEDGKVIEARDIVTRGEGENGTLIRNTRNHVTHNNTTTLIQIITACHQWAINTNTQSHMNNTLRTPNNSNMCHKDHQHNHDKLQTYANCAKIKAIMIINASLQAILWPTCKKLLIKVVHITTRILIKVTGQLGKMIITIPMDNLFNNGGS